MLMDDIIVPSTFRKYLDYYKLVMNYINNKVSVLKRSTKINE